MKKNFSLVAIAAVAATMFTSCSEKNGEETTSTAKLTLAVEKPTVAVAEKGKFTITSDINAPEAIVITVTSSDPKILTVDLASVTIAKDKKIIDGTFTAVANGTAKIKITTTTANVTMAKDEVEVTVGNDAVPAAKVEELFIEPATWPGFLVSSADGAVFFNFYEVSYGTELDGGISMDLGKGAVKGLGTLDASGYLLLTPQPAGTVINLADMKPVGKDRPIVWSPATGLDHTALATGEDVYIAIACGDWDFTSDDYRAWVKINIKPAGGISSITIIEGAYAVDKGEFKVGQK